MEDGKKPTQEMNPASKGSEKEAHLEQQDDTEGTRGLPRWIEGTQEFFTSGWMFVIPLVIISWGVLILIYALQLPSEVRWAPGRRPF